MKFTVIRSKWFRGQGSDDSRLLREDGYSCCLGFVGSACGVKDAHMEGIAAPCDIWMLGDWPEWMKPENGDLHSSDCVKAMQINDSEVITDATREDQLQVIFARNGDELTFVD